MAETTAETTHTQHGVKPMNATATQRKACKPARETNGTCFLTSGRLTLAEALDKGEALLTLHTSTCTNYTVLRLSDPDGETVGYRLVKLTDYIVDRQVYDIDIVGKDLVCDCPDACYRDRACKHARALKAVLTRHKLN
jgi:hypothetical protein